jgi:hypothetical protein
MVLDYFEDPWSLPLAKVLRLGACHQTAQR